MVAAAGIPAIPPVQVLFSRRSHTLGDWSVPRSGKLASLWDVPGVERVVAPQPDASEPASTVAMPKDKKMMIEAWATKNAPAPAPAPAPAAVGEVAASNEASMSLLARSFASMKKTLGQGGPPPLRQSVPAGGSDVTGPGQRSPQTSSIQHSTPGTEAWAAAGVAAAAEPGGLRVHHSNGTSDGGGGGGCYVTAPAAGSKVEPARIKDPGCYHAHDPRLGAGCNLACALTPWTRGLCVSGTRV